MQLVRHLGSLALVVGATVARPALGHGHDEDHADVALQMAFFRDAVDFSRLVEVKPTVTPVFRLGKHLVTSEGPLAHLVRSKLRAWHPSLREECGDCVDVNPEEWSRKADALVAKSFIEAKVGDKFLDVVEHVSLGTTNIAAELGFAPGVAKGVFEVGESILALAKWGGMHVFCHVFDAIVLFGTRPLQTAVRGVTWAPSVGSSRLATFARMGFVSAAVRRAERKVEFVNGPYQLSSAELAEIDREGPNRYWGWIKPGKRAKWMQKLDARGRALLDGRAYRGQRMKRYAFLLARKRGHRGHLQGDDFTDRALDHDLIWVMGVQENVVRPAFKPTDEPSAEVLASLVDKYTPEHDDVRESIAKEFGGDASSERTHLMSQILREVEVVFDPKIPQRVRYFQARKIEGILSGFMRNNLVATMHEAGELYSAEARTFWGKLFAIGQRIHMHFRSLRFSHYMLGVGDFLRVSALSNDAEALVGKKFETMDSVRRIFGTLELSGGFATARNVDELRGVVGRVADARDKLLAFRPWIEKRAAFSWLPFKRARPRCEDMNEKATR